MKRILCVLTVIIILIIIALYKGGISIFDYKGKTEGKFTAIIESKATEKQYVNSYIATIEKKKFILYIPKNIQEFKLGSLIEIEATYQEPQSQRNSGGFDYKIYLKTKKIYGSFKVSSAKLITNSNKVYLIENLKSYIETIARNNLKSENANLLIGLLLGDKENISEDVVENFRKASLSHILAVSGAHFSYVILVVSFLSKRLKRKRIGQIIKIFSIIFFMNLTGNTPSVIRAGIMNILPIIASILHRKADFWTDISISLLVQILNNPYVIFDMGLILSYGGVIGIVLFYNYIHKKIKFKMISVTLSANICIIPIMMYNFNTISLSFLISNILASNLLGIIIILGFVSVIIQIKPVYFVLDILLKILNQIAEISAKIPFSNIYVSTPNIFSIIMFYILIFLIIKKRKKLIPIIIILIIIFNVNYEKIILKINDSMIINFIDVGQGDSTLIRTKDTNLIIDSGGSADGKYDVGKNILLPYLLDKKITKIDYIMISHFDADHCQGFMYVMNNIKVKNAIISKQAIDSELYQEFLRISQKKRINIIYAKQGDNINIKNLNLEILKPGDNFILNNPLNNNAIVCKLRYKSFSMLFTGDIEKEAENELLKEKTNIKADVLKVGHHGSKTSSEEELLKKISPKIALIGVGKNNKFGHPNSTTIEKLENIKCKIYRTDLNGEICLKINKSGKILVNTKLK